jgi:hypothetical protein
VLITAGVGVAVSEHEPPAVTGCMGHHVLHAVTGGDVEGEVVEAGAEPIVTERAAGRRLLKDDVGATSPPALSFRPLLEELITESAEQPAPAGLGPGQVGHPQFDVVNRPRGNLSHSDSMPH